MGDCFLEIFAHDPAPCYFQIWPRNQREEPPNQRKEPKSRLNRHVVRQIWTRSYTLSNTCHDRKTPNLFEGWKHRVPKSLVHQSVEVVATRARLDFHIRLEARRMPQTFLFNLFRVVRRRACRYFTIDKVVHSEEKAAAAKTATTPQTAATKAMTPDRRR